MYHIINAGKNIITIVQKLYVDTVIITSEYALAGSKYNTYNAGTREDRSPHLFTPRDRNAPVRVRIRACMIFSRTRDGKKNRLLLRDTVDAECNQPRRVHRENWQPLTSRATNTLSFLFVSTRYRAPYRASLRWLDAYHRFELPVHRFCLIIIVDQGQF